MNTLTKCLAISAMVLLTACGAKSEAPTSTESAPKIDKSAGVTADLPANTPAFDVHLAALNQIADDMDAINSRADALVMKKRIANNVIVMNASMAKYQEQAKVNKTAQINAFRAREKEYTAAQERYLKAIKRLGEDHPKLFGIIAVEIAKMSKNVL